MTDKRLMWSALCTECGFEVEKLESKYAAKNRLKKLHNAIVPDCSGVINERYTVFSVKNADEKTDDVDV